MQQSGQSSKSQRGIGRREWLQVGCSTFAGISLPAALVAGDSDAASTARAKSVVLIYLTGGASHHDTFDMKPVAAAEIRGPFQAIDTVVPGLQVCELLPKMASCAHRYAVVRSMSHEETSHPQATHRVLTGALFPPERNATPVASRSDFPCYGAALQYLRPRSDGIPSGVTLPNPLFNPPTMWPGQNAGCLGARFDPWQLQQDPKQPQQGDPTLTLPMGFSVDRVTSRRSLLAQVNSTLDRIGRIAEQEEFSDRQQFALDLLTSSQMGRAFDLEREPASVRDRYGRHTFGQSLLLARRLVEIGVPVLQVNLGNVQHWDTHVANFERLKNTLLPPFDMSVSAFLEDLHQSGRLSETLVIVAGEFGRTPKISTMPGQTLAGRDHWSSVFSALFAGAGVIPGRVLGRSDDVGAYSLTQTFSLYDLGATVYEALGVPLDGQLHDQFGRPLQLNHGTPMMPLYSTAEL